MCLIPNVRVMVDREALKGDIGDVLCDYCPWCKGEIEHTADGLCEGSYCDEALDAFLDENEEYLDDDENADD